MKKAIKRISIPLAALALLALVTGCGKTQKELEKTKAELEAAKAELAQAESARDAAEAKAAEASDYNGKLVFDRSMRLDYASNFKVDYYKGGYKLLTVYNRPEDALEGYIPRTSQFLLVPEGMDAPANLDEGVTVLRAPVGNMLVASNGAVSQLNAIGALDTVSMVTTEAKSWYIDEVKTAMDAGEIRYVGSYKAPEYETLVASGSKLAVFSTMLASAPEVAEQLVDTCGMAVMLDQSSYEAHPLGRIEWLRFYGALTGHEEEADGLFSEQKELVASLSSKESGGKSVAIFYITSEGKLYVRNQKDYMAKMAELAGFDYIPDSIGEDETGTTNITMEAFYESASQADYIIYLWSLGGKPATLAELVAMDEILADFKAVRDGNVWCTTQEFFQINDRLGTAIEDFSEMQTTGADELDYLFKLK